MGNGHFYYSSDREANPELVFLSWDGIKVNHKAHLKS